MSRPRSQLQTRSGWRRWPGTGAARRCGWRTCCRGGTWGRRRCWRRAVCMPSWTVRRGSRRGPGGGRWWRRGSRGGWRWEAWIDRPVQGQLFAEEEPSEDMPCGCHDLRVRRQWRAPFSPYRARPARLDPYRHLFGRVPDAEIARRAGVDRSVVSKMRRRMYIAAVGRGA